MQRGDGAPSACGSLRRHVHLFGDQRVRQQQREMLQQRSAAAEAGRPGGGKDLLLATARSGTFDLFFGCFGIWQMGIWP